MKNHSWLLFAAVAFALILGSRAALAHNLIASMEPVSFSPGSTVAEGALVAITGDVNCTPVTGHACPTSLLGVGQIQIRMCTQDGTNTPALGLAWENCKGLALPAGTWVQIAQGAPTTTAGTFSTGFDTADLGGLIIGFETRYFGPVNGHNLGNCTSNGCVVMANLTIEAGDPPCHNNVGDTCAGLSQGAYGNANTVANCLVPGCNPWNDEIGTGTGFIPEANAQGYNVFAGDPNATTIGIHDIRSITVAPKSDTGGDGSSFSIDRQTLITLLPLSGTPQLFDTAVVAPDDHYASETDIPFTALSGGDVARMKKRLGGELASQAMTASLNSFLSGKPGGLFAGEEEDEQFGDYLVPALEDDVVPLRCTYRTKSDESFSCQASRFPTCVAGATVSQVLQAANETLAGGPLSNVLDLETCSASELNTALDLFNTMFDEQGTIMECPDPAVIVDKDGNPLSTEVDLDDYLSAPGKALFTPCSDPNE
ncbi:MAG: hypothetical protein HY651_06460 [Acidobacteria bacterium]|nr:hypothetical protein [Acidobacteriota bacterium]